MDKGGNIRCVSCLRLGQEKIFLTDRIVDLFFSSLLIQNGIGYVKAVDIGFDLMKAIVSFQVREKGLGGKILKIVLVF